MIPLFNKLMSSPPAIRLMRDEPRYRRNLRDFPLWISFPEVTTSMNINRRMLWEEILRQHSSADRDMLALIVSSPYVGKLYWFPFGPQLVPIIYTFAPWKNIPLYWTGIQSRLDRNRVDPGLKDLTLTYPRQIKNLTLADTIFYSLTRDIRFSVAVCTLLGLAVWWGLAPDPILLKPDVLGSTDLPQIMNVAKDTYVHGICSDHPAVYSPCDCGEPRNKELRVMMERESFDPLDLNQSTVKAFAIYCSMFLLTVALAESVSPLGVFLNS